MDNQSSSSSSSLSFSLSTSNDRYKLDNLHYDIYCFHLFEYLPLDDVFKLKLVSKRFNNIVKSYNITKLAFLDDKMFYKKFYWFQTSESTKLRNSLLFYQQNILKNPPVNFLNLRYLLIDAFDYHLIRLEDLNKFSRLRIVDLRGIKANFAGQLRLPNLTALSIMFEFMNEDDKENGELVIDAPNLQSARIGSLIDLDNDPIRLVHQLSIKYLQLINFKMQNVSEIANLECLSFCSCNADQFEIVDDATKLESLKVIKITDENVDESIGIRKLKNLLLSKRNSLELIVDGVKIRTLNKLDECKNETPLQFQANNFDVLENNLNYFVSFDYNSLMKVWPTNRLSDLFEKYTNILLLQINPGIDDEGRLSCFIEKCFNLSILLIRGKLSQQFYDQLPTISILSSLSISESDNDLNFDFITKMTHLSYLHVDRIVLIKENLNFNKLKFFKVLAFKVDHVRKVFVCKRSTDSYEIQDCDISDHLYRLLKVPKLEILDNFTDLVRWSNNLSKEN